MNIYFFVNDIIFFKPMVHNFWNIHIYSMYLPKKVTFLTETYLAISAPARTETDLDEVASL